MAFHRILIDSPPTTCLGIWIGLPLMMPLGPYILIQQWWQPTPQQQFPNTMSAITHSWQGQIYPSKMEDMPSRFNFDWLIRGGRKETAEKGSVHWFYPARLRKMTSLVCLPTQMNHGLILSRIQEDSPIDASFEKDSKMNVLTSFFVFRSLRLYHTNSVPSISISTLLLPTTYSNLL